MLLMQVPWPPANRLAAAPWSAWLGGLFGEPRPHRRLQPDARGILPDLEVLMTQQAPHELGRHAVDQVKPELLSLLAHRLTGRRLRQPQRGDRDHVRA